MACVNITSNRICWVSYATEGFSSVSPSGVYFGPPLSDRLGIFRFFLRRSSSSSDVGPWSLILGFRPNRTFS